VRWRSTSYSEKTPESPNEMWAADASRTLRRYVISGDAASRYQAARDFLGYATLLSAVVAGKKQWFISRVTPHPLSYATAAGANFLYAQSIPHSEPIGVTAPDPNLPDLTGANRVLLTCEYRTLTYDVLPDSSVLAATGTLAGFPDEGWALANGNSGASVLTTVTKAGDLATPWLTAGRYVTRLFRPGGKFLTLRQGMMRFVDGSATPVPEGLPVTVPYITASYTHHQVPVAGFPAAAAFLAQGTLNNAAFDGWPAQTMLLLNYTPRPYRDAFGNRVLDIEYVFKISPNLSRDGTGTPRGHNWVLRYIPATGKVDYVQVSSDGTVTGTPPYLATDFSLLFKPDQN